NENSTIKYTLDGTIPSSNSGIVYESPVKIYKSLVIKAVCVASDYAVSDILTKTYTITGKVSTPNILLESGTYNGAVKLEIESNTYDSVIHYTINGNTPTENDFVYNGPVSLVSGDKNLNIKVKSFKSGLTSSDEVGCSILFKLPEPSFNPQEGLFNKDVNLVISQPVLGSTTRYTIDGTEPSETNGILYNGSVIVIKSNTTIKAISYKNGWENSNIISANYKIQ
ncbi:MAG TPA: FN3 associated domain-containing protein, partial [Spirochaetota bacterium]|nr:FN3 associated domain-containing protein [Spirochaetota bacterium]